MRQTYDGWATPELAAKAREAAHHRHLRYQANELCNALCHKLDWRREREEVERLRRVLARARARLARRMENKP